MQANPQKIKKTLPLLKHNLALLTWGQKCTVSTMHLFNLVIFQMGHPVNACFIIRSSLSLLPLWLIKLICECKMLAGKPINKGSKRQILPSKVHSKHY